MPRLPTTLAPAEQFTVDLKLGIRRTPTGVEVHAPLITGGTPHQRLLIAAALIRAGSAIFADMAVSPWKGGQLVRRVRLMRRGRPT